jgi:hypothetical protein
MLRRLITSELAAAGQVRQPIRQTLACVAFEKFEIIRRLNQNSIAV